MIADLVEGEPVDDVFLVEESDLRRARNGSLYVHLRLFDRSGRIDARKWDAREKDVEGIAPGTIARIAGFVESYRGRPQLIARQIRPASEGEFQPADFLPVAAQDGAAMRAELAALLGTIRDPHLAALVKTYLDDAEFMARFSEAPAAVRLHHACLGGLMEHTLSLMRAAVAVADLYTALDRDLLLTGAFLHDTGKTKELGYGTVFTYTDGGRLLGHISMGAAMLAEKAAGVEGFPPEKREALLHLVLSHHGRYEFGSPKLPMTAEALALNLLDDLDAKLGALEELRKGEIKQGWSDFVRGFDRAFFLGRE